MIIFVAATFFCKHKQMNTVVGNGDVGRHEVNGRKWFDQFKLKEFRYDLCATRSKITD